MLPKLRRQPSPPGSRNPVRPPRTSPATDRRPPIPSAPPKREGLHSRRPLGRLRRRALPAALGAQQPAAATPAPTTTLNLHHPLHRTPHRRLHAHAHLLPAPRRSDPYLRPPLPAQTAPLRAARDRPRRGDEGGPADRAVAGAVPAQGGRGQAERDQPGGGGLECESVHAGE